MTSPTLAHDQGLSNGHAEKVKSPSTTKRKRSDSLSTHPQPAAQLFQDLLDIFTKHDPQPSVLHLALPNASRLTQSDGPSTKRPKLAEADTHDTIASRLENKLYLSLDELDHDLDDAFTSLFEPIKQRDGLNNNQRLSQEDIKSMQRLSDFRTLVKRCLDDSTPVKKEAAPQLDEHATGPEKVVLSLFGNAPNPRQLFSSLQQPDSTIDGANVSLEELGLPNMLSASRVLPLQPDNALGSRKALPTFADVFPPPASLPPLNPPKPAKHSSSKSSTISWSVGDLPKASRKAGYTLQPLTVGSWVGYGGVENKESVSAIKRRRRESLLNGLDQSKSTEEPPVVDVAAQESALFRAAYSSFAPTQDNSKALVAKETKDMVWWHRMGQKRFNKHFVLDPALQESAFPVEIEESAKAAAEQEAAMIAGEDDLKEIEKAIEDFDEDAFKPANFDLVSTINEEEREVEQMLSDISELLKALSSHQRIRNSYIPTASRNPTSPSPLLSTMVGTSTAPTAEENETYRALRSQLAQMISKLPPYAVAKLDGEQFEDLAIKKNIVIQGKEYQGNMEEDQLTRMIRSTAAMQAAANASGQKTDPAQYGRSPSVSNRSAHTPSNYYNSRTPATNQIRSGTSQSYSNAPATAPRQGYGNTYNSQGGRSSFSQSQYYQRPTYAAQYSAQTPQPANPARAGYNVPQTAYAPRTTTSSFANGTPSSTTYNQQNYAPTRPVYATAGTPVAGQNSYGSRPQNHAPAQQQPSSGRATPTFAQPQAPNTSSVGPSGFHSTLSAEQQQTMLDRQRASLAMQPQSRMAAQTAPMGGNSPAPQAPMQSQGQQPNGQA